MLKKELPSWLPIALAVAGAILYFVRAVMYAHSTVSSLDEGAYLIKGILYARGVYTPFEPYGPLTNKAPFAFLIYGLVESIFGAGLRTGRYFSIFLGLLTLLGTWIVARRWAGNWLAAGVVWFFALSSMIVKLYSQGISQVVIACTLVWICVLILDEERPLWQIVLASVLSAVAIFTRQNMAPILPLLVLYVFWQHGKQKGLWALAAGSIALLAFHIFYWPRVMSLWAPWLPETLTPFFDPFRLPKDSVAIWNPDIDFSNRLNAFFQGIRYHYLPILGGIFALMLLPPRTGWKSASAMRAAFFLAVSYFLLAAMHGWASLASQYESYSCVFCFANYLGFFEPLGILFVVIAFAHAWNQNPHRAWTAAAVLLVIVVAIGMGYSVFEQVGDGLLNLSIVPRIRDGQSLNWVGIADTLKYGLGLETVQIKRVISGGIGLMLGLLVLIAAFLFWRRQRSVNFTLILVNTSLIAGFVFAPLLNLGASQKDCQTDIIRDHEKLGAYMASIIPPDSLVYWDGGNAYTPMIYVVPQVRIFPIQINDGYTFRIGGDPDVLHYFSHWNAELDERWRGEADVFIIEAKRYVEWREFLSPQNFQEFAKPAASPSCVEGAELRIFKRLP